ncbi:MAG TPA: cytochrome c biogenesis protein ResB [Urbifossiella sp.]|nr:cytochrome c biogenesis protein ResB [Urbifossiella sp.]
MSTTIDSPAVAGTAGYPVSRTQPGIAPFAAKTLKALASLQLTVVLFAFAIVLIFFGTLAQRDSGIWTVVEKYFWSWYVLVPIDLIHQFGTVFFDQSKESQWSGAFPLPGGKLLGGVMLLNLLAAHAKRFRLTWKRSGVLLLHSGLILLFVGEFITREFAVEQRMVIDEGMSVNYAEASRHYELAIIDPSDPDSDSVTVVPGSMLRPGKGRISDPRLPVDIQVVKYMANSRSKDLKPGEKNPATAGRGVQPHIGYLAVEQPEVSGVDPNQAADLPAAYITLYKKGTDESLGTYLVSLPYSLQQIQDEFEIDGKKYLMSLRFQRFYKPFRVELVKFHFDRHPGTQNPKNYSSDVIVFDDQGAEVRRQTIRMNEPMRFEGDAFYQQSFMPTETATILQVVRNPGWLIPYISCIMVGLGLFVHFSIGLIRFLIKLYFGTRRTADAPAAPVASVPGGWLQRNFSWLIPAAMVGLVLMYLGSVYGRMKPKDDYDLDAFAHLPALDDGRVKPLDSVARVYLRQISHLSDYKDANGEPHPAIRWYLQTLGAKPNDESEPAWSLPVIRVDNDQLLAELKLAPREGLRYSYNEVRAHLPELQNKAFTAFTKQKAGKSLELFETKLLDLTQRLELLRDVAQGFGKDSKKNRLHLVPPQVEGAAWESLGQYRSDAQAASINDYVEMLREKARPRLTDDELRRLLGEAGANATAEEIQRMRTTLLDAPIAELHRRGNQVLEGALGLLRKELTEAEVAELVARADASLTARMDANPAGGAWNALIETRHAIDALKKERSRPGIKVEEAKKLDEQIASQYAAFNATVRDYRAKYLGQVSSAELTNSNLEIKYNRFAPFYRCIALYILAFLLSTIGFVFNAAEWPRLGDALRRSATLVILLTLAIHGSGLIVRMDLMNRWTVFVTNLYSSALFIGFGCAALGVILEKAFPIGIGNIVGSVLGAVTLLIAHNIATEDTLAKLEAVLDTNFWLATHVTTVTFGYTATFVAGFLGIAYLFQMFCTVIRDSFQTPGPPTPGGLLAYGAAAAGIVVIPLSVGWVLFDALAKFDYLPGVLGELLRYGMVAVGGVYIVALLAARAVGESVDSHGHRIAAPIPRLAAPIAGMALTPHVSKVLNQMIYGVACFATMLSFIGTVLGGIWADQSWGRFWGWDAKENGAVIIVLMNSLILHARWCGLVKTRGMAVLAVLGNMVTAWSWFGTNQLQIGLHSYGFDTRLAEGCAQFWVGMGVIALLGLIPQRFWSASPTASVAATPAASVAATQRGARR